MSSALPPAVSPFTVSPLVSSPPSAPFCSPPHHQAITVTLTDSANTTVSVLLNRFTNILQFTVLSSPNKIGSILRLDSETPQQVKFLLGARPSLTAQSADSDVIPLPDLYSLFTRQLYSLFNESILLEIGWRSISLDGIRSVIQAIKQQMAANTADGEQAMEEAKAMNTASVSAGNSIMTQGIQQLTLGPNDII